MREEIKKELQDLQSSLIHHEGSKKPQVPEGYFDQLPDVVWARVHQQHMHKSSPAKIIKLNGVKLLAYAATLMLGIWLLSQIWTSTSPTITAPDINELSKEDIHNYLQNNSEYLEFEDLMPLINQPATEPTEEWNLPFDQSELENYFESENLDLDQIL